MKMLEVQAGLGMGIKKFRTIFNAQVVLRRTSKGVHLRVSEALRNLGGRLINAQEEERRESDCVWSGEGSQFGPNR